jgi:hypothetical protein
MKKTVLTFGLASGAVAVAFMGATVPFIAAKELRTADLLGYSAMVASALLVFLGIRSYRQKAGSGRLTFSRGFAVGLLIAAVASACSVVAFEIVYFQLVPDFGEQFAACMVERARAGGATPEKLERVTEQAATLKRLYDRPATNAALTFATSFPVGLASSAIAAAILRRR